MTQLLTLTTTQKFPSQANDKNYVPYVYVPDSFSFNAADPEALVDQMIKGSQTSGARLVRALAKIQDKKVIKLLLTAGVDPEDPCNTGLPEDLAGAAQGLIDLLGERRSELVTVIAAVQTMRNNQQDISTVIKAASEAVQAMQPLVPAFNQVFEVNEECTNTLAAADFNFERVAEVLNTLGTTDLLSGVNKTVLASLRQGGEATRIASRTARALQEYAHLCPGSSQFSGNMLEGMAELLTGAETFEL